MKVPLLLLLALPSYGVNVKFDDLPNGTLASGRYDTVSVEAKGWARITKIDNSVEYFDNPAVIDQGSIYAFPPLELPQGPVVCGDEFDPENCFPLWRYAFFSEIRLDTTADEISFAVATWRNGVFSYVLEDSQGNLETIFGGEAGIPDNSVFVPYTITAPPGKSIKAVLVENWDPHSPGSAELRLDNIQVRSAALEVPDPVHSMGSLLIVIVSIIIAKLMFRKEKQQPEPYVLRDCMMQTDAHGNRLVEQAVFRGKERLFTVMHSGSPGVEKTIRRLVDNLNESNES